MTLAVPYTSSSLDNESAARSTADEGQNEIPKQPLEQEFGVGSIMPFSVPYDGPRQGSDTLYEALRPLGEDEGPSVSQLMMMRRTDGQARALYRLVTQPIRSALKGAKIISSSAAEQQASGVQVSPTMAPKLAPTDPDNPEKPVPGTELQPPKDAGSQQQAAKTAIAGQGSQVTLAAVPVELQKPDADPDDPRDPNSVEVPVDPEAEDKTDVNVTQPKAPGDDEAEFINLMLKLPPNAGGMTITWRRFMAQLLMGVFDGFAPFELVYHVPQVGPLKGKWTLQKAAYRPANTITFLTDKGGAFKGLRQRTFMNGETVDTKIEPENVLYYAANEEERQFYGVSYFQTAFYHYDKKAKLYYIAHLAAQRAATGTRVGTMPLNAGANDKRNFQNALADLGVAQYITLPGPDWKVEVLRGEAATFDYINYVNHHNSQMSKSLLATFMDQSQGSGKGESPITSGGGSGSEGGMSDMFIALLKTIMDDIAEIINTVLIPRFIDWNFGSALYPQFQWGTFTDDQQKVIRTTFETLATAGSFNVTPEFMRALEEYMAKELGLDIDYAEVAAREQTEQAQAQAMQEQLAQGQLPTAADQLKPGEGGATDPKPEAAGVAQVLAAAKGKMANSPMVGMTNEESDLALLSEKLLALAASSVG